MVVWCGCNHYPAVGYGREFLCGGAFASTAIFLGREEGGVGRCVVVSSVPMGWGVFIPMVCGRVVDSGRDLMVGG